VLGDVLPTTDLVDYWVDAIEEQLEGTTLELGAVMFPGKHGRIHRDPRGVVAVIAPWNYPLAIALRTIVPALLCGNAVVLKPSEVTPRSGALLASLFEGLLPEGVLTLVQGGPDVGAALVAAPIDLVVFTGGTRAGRAVARACAERFVPCSLELGGKDAAIVLADCNLDRTARGVVWGAFNNSGQNCASIERVYVEKSIAEPFIRRVVELTKELQPGRDVSELATPAQRALVVGQIREAVAAGAELLCGGAPEEGDQALAPTVLRVESDDLGVMREETFGPVLPIRVVADVDEAIERANDCRYALSTSVWTRRTSWAHGLARRLRAGVVTINNHGFTAVIPAAPWTGPGDTGGGITNSPHALATLTRVRFVLEDSGRMRREPWWYPYSPLFRAMVLALVALRGGAGLMGRIVAFFRLLLAAPRRTLGKG
jgi:acyl-CoA reductase-like NAD-dependent aldehyde dehydrogenase